MAYLRWLSGIVALLVASGALAQCPQPDCCGECTDTGDPNNPSSGDLFGTSVSVDGSTAVVGSPRDDDEFTDQGRAFVYVFDNGSWDLDSILEAISPQAGADFGQAVAINGNTAVVGAPAHDIGGDVSAGRAYIFDASDGDQLAILSPDGGSSKNDAFGSSVAVEGNIAVVGAPGVASGTGEVFVFDGTNSWAEIAVLTASNGTTGDDFGSSVSIDGDIIVVGAPGAGEGAVYVFEEPTGGWDDATQDAILTPSDGATGDGFGFSVDADGSRIVVGAPFHDEGTTIDGVVYIFEEPGAGWANEDQDYTLVGCDDGAQPVDFGYAVGIEGDVLVIGARRDTDEDTGIAYAVRYFSGYDPNPAWVHMKAMTPVDGADLDQFGTSVGISGDLVVVGAPAYDIGGGFFEFQGFDNLGDVDDDGKTGIDDFLAVIGLWGSCATPCPPCTGDVTDDCEVDIG